MTEAVQLFLAIGLIVGFAKAPGYVSLRLNQPAVHQGLLAGLLPGPSVLDLLGHAALCRDSRLTGSGI